MCEAVVRLAVNGPQTTGHCLTASTAGNVKKAHSYCANGKFDKKLKQKLVCECVCAIGKRERHGKYSAPVVNSHCKVELSGSFLKAETNPHEKFFLDASCGCWKYLTESFWVHGQEAVRWIANLSPASSVFCF